MFLLFKRSAMKLIMMMGLVAVLTGLMGFQPVSAEDGSAPGATSKSAEASSDRAAPTKKTTVSEKDYRVKEDGVTLDVTRKTTTRTTFTPYQVEPNSTSTEEECVNKGEVSPTRVELVACSYSETALETSASAATRALIEGATQLTWWYPNHHVTVTNKAIKNAPWVKVKYTKCSKQSKSIAKQAHGASLVIAKVGSVICNSGKLGKLVGGFKWKVQKGPAILKWNKKLHLYEHVFNLIVPGNVQADDTVVGYVTVNGTRYAIVKTCKNRMGGHVDKMFEVVVQVRNEGDVINESEVTGKSSGQVSVQGVLRCPAGTLTGTATVATETLVTIMVRAKASTMMKAIEMAEGIVKAEASSKAKGNASAQSRALAAITLECSENPPTYDECPNIPGDQPQGYPCYPPANPPTFMQFRQINDVYVNATTDHCVTVDFPDGHNGSVFWTANKGSFAIATKAAQDAVQVCSSYKAPSEVPASGTDTITVTATDNVTGKSVSKTTDPFTIKAMPATP